ncbi:amidase signature enzyme [Dipodascopsis tothii]|uniref:amidase signature enzyme n=1 Tax=Dipodascopsis tothii TaxID=44089 RepID=UPI0034CD569F
MSVVKLPEKISFTPSQLQAVAAQVGVTVPAADVTAYCTLLSGLEEAAELIEAQEDYVPKLDLHRFPRESIHRPTAEENLADFNGWAYRVTVKSTSAEDAAGPLAGKTLAIKDNVNIGGVPSMLGTDVFPEPYVPVYDATIVSRILAAGGTIVGKAACENFSMSPTSFTNAHANVQHPMAPGHNAGGSSSGSAALLCGKRVDLAIGGDQGGSIRVPAAYCGLVGLKPTFGLVPYTGIASLAAIVDHAGPMSHTVLDNALLLGVIAGQDGLDDRQLYAPAPGKIDYVAELAQYAESPKSAVAGMKIGILVEGFEMGGVDPELALKVRTAADMFRALGAEVVEVSVPMHALGPAIWTVATRQGIAEHGLFASNPLRFGVHDAPLNKELYKWNQDKFESLQLHNPAATNAMLGGLHIKEAYPGLTDKAINLGRKLKDTYEAVFRDQGFDVLITPCAPFVSNMTSQPTDDILTKMSKAIGTTQNTAPFNISGHPALSLPVGMLPSASAPEIKLPIGMQMVAAHFNEIALYRAAYAWEQTFDWHAL